ncbi:hypothetical protein TNCV_5085211 [Trichonephila clavipes]|uniref:DUF7041 domain-containing protein n=1 Tax=Trichonephila clavipes TaxID=2585209 RepID=A0A8X6S9U6_TRICX|nr:hypothetical protein TNCV_5085211 [Trichonephila clavipes]
MLESTFEQAFPKSVTDERMKYNYCVAHLSLDETIAVRDVILSPWNTNPYSELKEEQLPPTVQSILASIQPLTAQKASEAADRILYIGNACTGCERTSTIEKFFNSRTRGKSPKPTASVFCGYQNRYQSQENVFSPVP